MFFDGSANKSTKLAADVRLNRLIFVQGPPIAGHRLLVGEIREMVRRRNAPAARERVRQISAAAHSARLGPARNSGERTVLPVGWLRYRCIVSLCLVFTAWLADRNSSNTQPDGIRFVFRRRSSGMQSRTVPCNWSSNQNLRTVAPTLCPASFVRVGLQTESRRGCNYALYSCRSHLVGIAERSMQGLNGSRRQWF